VILRQEHNAPPSTPLLDKHVVIDFSTFLVVTKKYREGRLDDRGIDVSIKLLIFAYEV
jgi:hypothetical protein